jgi:hypothetical protein
MGAIPVTIIGTMTYSDVGVGGGPMPGGPFPSHPWVPPSPGVPTHPWVPPGLGFWGGVAPPYPDQGLPGAPPSIWPSPGHPAHPIAGPPPQIWPSPGHPAHPIASPPLGIWGGGNVPMPTPPIYLPGGSIPGTKPEHPIFLPPSIWPSPGVPSHPIVLPGDGAPEVLKNWDVKTAWSPQTGWIVAVVPSEQHPGVPTPSA